MEKPEMPAEIKQNLPPAVVAYIAYLEARLVELEARLNQNSQNSSKPPSSDPPGTPPRPPKTRPGRKRGGQKGHKGHSRKLVGVEEVAEVKEWWPGVCKKCQRVLRPRDQVGQPLGQQVWEIPKVKAHITEHQYYQCECPGCGCLSRAERSAQVGPGSFGPRLSATVAVLHGRYRLSSREIVAVAQTLWGLELSLGSVIKLCQKSSKALATPYHQAENSLKQSQQSYTDETGWKRGKLRRWLWVGVSRLVTLFRLSETRGSAAAKQLLGEGYAGVVISDRLRSYNWLEQGRHQWCWAHLLRDIRGLSQRAGPGGEWGQEMLEMVGQLFEQWQLYQKGGQALAELGESLQPIRADIKQLLLEGQTHPDGAVRSLSVELGKAEESLWVFSQVEGVEPTNNRAERALRPGVIWRKTCFGTQSEEGERFVERILTVSATLKQQGRDLLEFVEAALKAYWCGDTPPALLPS